MREPHTVTTLIENADLFWAGFWATLRLTLASGVIALVVGTLLAALRVSPIPPLRGLGTAYVELVRNTPLTVVFFFVVFVAPQLGIQIDFFASAIVALSLYTSAFVCEAVRSGINSVGTGQAEAARSIGLTFPQVLSQVVLPQALRTVVPPLINVFIALAKNTSVAGGFFVAELFNVGRRLSNAFSADIPWVLGGVAVGYLAVTVSAGLLANRVERRVGIVR